VQTGGLFRFSGVPKTEPGAGDVPGEGSPTRESQLDSRVCQVLSQALSHRVDIPLVSGPMIVAWPSPEQDWRSRSRRVKLAHGDQPLAPSILRIGFVLLVLTVSLSSIAQSAQLAAAENVLRLQAAGNYPEMERAARALLLTQENSYGPNSTETAEALDLLAVALLKNGKSGEREAREVCNRALEIKASTSGKQTATYAASLTNLGAILITSGAYEEARAPLEGALAIRERTLGRDHLDVAHTLLWLGTLRVMQDDPKSADPLLVRAVSIRKAVLGAGHVDVAECVNALAGARYNEGDFSSAASLWEEALASYLAARGPNHPSVATCHHNLGALYNVMGDFEQARTHLLSAARVRRDRLGPEHPLLASTLNLLAFNFERSGSYRDARARYEEALRIEEKAYGRENPECGWTLMRLGLLHLAYDDTSGARRCLQEAREIQEKTMGEENTDLAWTLGGLAAVAARHGDLQAAAELYRRVLRIEEKAYGPMHPDVAGSLVDYAVVLARDGRTDDALEASLRAADVERVHLRLTVRGFSEREGLVYSATLARALDVALSLAARERAPADVVRRVWDSLIRSRTLVLDEMVSRQRIAHAGVADPRLAEAARAVTERRQELADRLVRGGETTSRRMEVYRAREALERAERQLGSSSEAFRTEREERNAGYAEVISSLRSGEALVAFTLCRSGMHSRASYMALVMRPGRIPAAVDLGPSDRIDGAITRWIRAISLGSRSSGASDPDEAKARALGEGVRALTWDPVARFLEGARHVHIVPDGLIYRVSFAALPTEASGYLIEGPCLISYLTSERDLLPRKMGRKGAGLLALGGPAYDAPAKAPSQTLLASGTARRGVPASEASTSVPPPDCSDFRHLRFPPLPESLGEVKAVAERWRGSDSVVVLTGPAATEEAFKELAPGKRVLHVATHGFFLEADCPRLSPQARGIGGLVSAKSKGNEASLRSPSLMLSGLVLARANHRDHVLGGQDDGVLTAQEISSLDLSSVEWVVLSACDTGLGAIQAGEGVLGLRRSFQVAGAGTTIMSLWSVEDRSARDWMTALYDMRFNRRLATADAVREASLSVLRARRAQGRSTHPFYWAAFVATGGR